MEEQTDAIASTRGIFLLNAGKRVLKQFFFY